MTSIKTLIAEDDKLGRKILEFYLKPYGDSIGAIDGEDAVAKFKEAIEAQQPFNLVLLDIGMPKLAGIEVLKAIRQIEKENNIDPQNKVKVIMLTGKPDVDNINSALLLGAADYMIKPIEENVLIRELQRLELIKDPFDSD